MKKSLLVLSALLAMSMAFVSCGGGAGDDPTGGDEVILFEDAAGWSQDWTAKNFDADKFANATNDSVFVLKVSKDTNKYVDDTADNPYADCYAIIQMLNYSAENAMPYGAGTSNTTLEAGDGGKMQLNLRGENGLFADEDDNTKFKEITYKPTAEEWASIKESGIGFQAHGTMFKKISIK